MKVLLDTNIIIHRETSKSIANADVSILYKWLERANVKKYIHPISILEIRKVKDQNILDDFERKLRSYEIILDSAKVLDEIQTLINNEDRNENDKNDSLLLNELLSGRFNFLISEDRKGLRRKANKLGLGEKVRTISEMLEIIISNNPELKSYVVLSVEKTRFGAIDLSDSFFDSFRLDYPSFDIWFNKKFDEEVYVSRAKNGKVASFLYLKLETESETYHDILPFFKAKRRLKIGTFKVVANGVKLGERFLKIVFDNALKLKVDEVYVTIYDRTDEQKRLIELLENFGFILWGTKSNTELVYVKDLEKVFNLNDPLKTFPYLDRNRNTFLVSIYPEYHTELMPDSILKTEISNDFIENAPHRNALLKIYVSHSRERNINKGDILIFYRTGGLYKGVLTSLCIVNEVLHHFSDENDFIEKSLKRSVYPEADLKLIWNRFPNYRPFVVSFLYTYAFPKKVNLKELIDNEIVKDFTSAPRGFSLISKDHFNRILKLTHTDESFIVN